jgi:hypothetical protein
MVQECPYCRSFRRGNVSEKSSPARTLLWILLKPFLINLTSFHGCTEFNDNLTNFFKLIKYGRFRHCLAVEMWNGTRFQLETQSNASSGLITLVSWSRFMNSFMNSRGDGSTALTFPSLLSFFFPYQPLFFVFFCIFVYHITLFLPDFCFYFRSKTFMEQFTSPRIRISLALTIVAFVGSCRIPELTSHSSFRWVVVQLPFCSYAVVSHHTSLLICQYSWAQFSSSSWKRTSIFWARAAH